jgi:LysM repeat protein
MVRRSIPHIASLVAVVAAFSLVEGSALAKTATQQAPTPAAHPATAKVPPARSYVVKPGDGWWQIAHDHGTTVPHLLAANHATASTPVNAGAHVKLPADARVTTKPAKATTAKQAPAAKKPR